MDFSFSCICSPVNSRLLTFDIDNTDIWNLIEYLEESATKKEEYIKKKGNTTGEFQWKIYEKYNGIKKLKAGFVNEMDA